VIVQRKNDWLFATVGEELVMMNAERGNYIGLSEVAARVWEMIEAPRAVDDVCAQLETEFDVAPETCRAEVAAFLNVMVEHGAVAIDPAPAA